ncbi:MAG: hypothetical protein V1851_00325 [Patescibacteria group bacterium]
MLKRALVRNQEVKIASAKEYRRDVGRFAKEADITLQEAFDFVNPIVREMFEEMLDQSEFSEGKKPEAKKFFTEHEASKI